MPSSLSTTDRSLMLLPFEQWVTVGATATSIVRVGRRRGVLRTRGKGAAQQVMRIYPGPRRPSRSPAGLKK
ncbi:hypothetical protein ABT039_17640 [Streptomyces lasiicapitis]|uniref:hypothetical protein n=1 Tax=Streptomyces lasiicapitis TaxID=1923961 RepID=UPI003327F1C6